MTVHTKTVATAPVTATYCPNTRSLIWTQARTQAHYTDHSETYTEFTGDFTHIRISKRIKQYTHVLTHMRLREWVRGRERVSILSAVILFIHTAAFITVAICAPIRTDPMLMWCDVMWFWYNQNQRASEKKSNAHGLSYTSAATVGVHCHKAYWVRTTQSFGCGLIMSIMPMYRINVLL